MQKRLLPYIVAVLTFAAITMIYFMPYYQGMKLSQGDITQWEGMSKEIVDWNQAHPDDPALWTNSMFGGMPGFQISLRFAGNFIDKIMEVLRVVFPETSVYMFLMFTGFYILLLCLEVDVWLSLAGALAYGFSTFFIMVSIEAGHNTKVQAISLMAPVLGGVILAYRKNILLGGAVTALFLSMLIDSNHFQIAYYMVMIVGFVGIYFLINSILEKKIAHFAKASGVLVIAAILAVIPNIGMLWSTQEYAKETIRGGSSELTQKKEATKGGGLDFEYASKWSYGLTDGEILTILIPNMVGGASGAPLSESSNTYKEMMKKGVSENQAMQYIRQMPVYWGNQPFTSGPVYYGAAVCFLFLLSMLIVRSRIKWAMLALTIFSILLGLGHNTPFFKWMFELLPFFNKFRTPTMALSIAQLTMPLMALLGLQEIIAGKIGKDDLIKKLKIAGGIIAGIVVLFGVLGGMFFDFTSAGDKQYYDNGNGWLIDAIKQDRASLLRMDAFRSLFFIAAAFGLIWFYVQKKLSKQILIGGIAMVFLLDGWLIGKRYLNTDNFIEGNQYQSNHTPTQADLDILKDSDPDYRVFNVTRDPFNDAMTSYYHKSVGGYHPAKLIRYQDLIEHHISKNNMSVLNMLNTKYFINQNPETKQPVAQRNPGALGHAWFVHDIKWVKNADEEVEALNNFDPANTVVIDERFKAKVGNESFAVDSGAAIRLLSYSPNKLAYASNANSSQLAVFSEIYYDDSKGWNAYIDGKKADHLRVDYTLRGMVIPAGTHQIEFRFEPKSVVEGNKIAYAGSFLLFAFVFGTFGFAGYKKMKEIETEPVAAKPTQTVSKSGKKK
ncbi:MAG: hypothetical protein IPP77_13610 [Bacteroidetes bacterium]|nr:hypothetical protein [Bacteroidota bacterium]